MKTIKTDSLGVEILTSISSEENYEIKISKTKEELEINIEEDILFEIYDNENITGYFILPITKYDEWVKEYKLEGVEI